MKKFVFLPFFSWDKWRMRRKERKDFVVVLSPLYVITHHISFLLFSMDQFGRFPKLTLNHFRSWWLVWSSLRLPSTFLLLPIRFSFSLSLLRTERKTDRRIPSIPARKKGVLSCESKLRERETLLKCTFRSFVSDQFRDKKCGPADETTVEGSGLEALNVVFGSRAPTEQLLRLLLELLSIKEGREEKSGGGKGNERGGFLSFFRESPRRSPFGRNLTRPFRPELGLGISFLELQRQKATEMAVG